MSYAYDALEIPQTLHLRRPDYLKNSSSYLLVDN